MNNMLGKLLASPSVRLVSLIIIFCTTIGVLYYLVSMLGGLDKEGERVKLHESIETEYIPTTIIYDPQKDVNDLISRFKTVTEELSKANKTDCSPQLAEINATNKKLQELTYQHNNCSIEINRYVINISLVKEELEAVRKICAEKPNCSQCVETECICPDEKPCICGECPEPLPPCPQCPEQEPCIQCDPVSPPQPCQEHPPCPECKPKECPKTTCPPQKECPPEPQPEPCICEQCEQPHICPVPQDPICPPVECPEPTPCDPKPDCPADCEAQTTRIEELTASLTTLQSNYAKLNKDKEECLKNSQEDCQQTDASYQQLINELPTIITEIQQTLLQSESIIKFTKIRGVLASIKQQLQSKAFTTTVQVSEAYRSLLTEMLSHLTKLNAAIPTLEGRTQHSKELFDTILAQLGVCEQKLRSL